LRKIRTYSSNEALVNERRMQIIKGATRLFVRKGYDGASMREVLQSCGMSAGALYNYVGSKDDIRDLIIDFATSRQAEIFEDISNHVADISPTEALRESVKAFLKSLDDMQDMFNFLNHVVMSLKPGKRRAILEPEIKVLTYFEELLKRGVEAGEFNIDDPKLAAMDIVLMANGWTHWRWFLEKEYTLEEYTEKAIQSLLKMINVNDSVTKAI